MCFPERRELLLIGSAFAAITPGYVWRLFGSRSTISVSEVKKGLGCFRTRCSRQRRALTARSSATLFAGRYAPRTARLTANVRAHSPVTEELSNRRVRRSVQGAQARGVFSQRRMCSPGSVKFFLDSVLLPSIRLRNSGETVRRRCAPQRPLAFIPPGGDDGRHNR